MARAHCPPPDTLPGTFSPRAAAVPSVKVPGSPSNVRQSTARCDLISPQGHAHRTHSETPRGPRSIPTPARGGCKNGK